MFRVLSNLVTSSSVASHLILSESKCGRETSTTRNSQLVDGFNIANDGWSETQFRLDNEERAELVDLLDERMATEKQPFESGDYRLWSIGGARSPKTIQKLFINNSLADLPTALMRRRFGPSVVMLNCTRPLEGNVGSGGGWHRDGFRDGLKIIFYLKSISEAQGPLSLISQSHKKSEMLRLHKEEGISPFLGNYRSRAFDSKIEGLIRAKRLERSILLPSEDGAGLIFNTRCLHRGMPIVDQYSSRYALTIYLEPVNRQTVRGRRVSAGRITV